MTQEEEIQDVRVLSFRPDGLNPYRFRSQSGFRVLFEEARKSPALNSEVRRIFELSDDHIKSQILHSRLCRVYDKPIDACESQILKRKVSRAYDKAK